MLSEGSNRLLGPLENRSEDPVPYQEQRRTSPLDRPSFWMLASRPGRAGGSAPERRPGFGGGQSVIHSAAAS